jgi:hypothetical protein
MSMPGFEAEASLHGTMLGYKAVSDFEHSTTSVWPQACACPGVADSVCGFCAFPLANAEAICGPLLVLGCDAFLKCIYAQLVMLAPFCLGTGVGPTPGCVQFAKDLFCPGDGSGGPPPPPRPDCSTTGCPSGQYCCDCASPAVCTSKSWCINHICKQ